MTTHDDSVELTMQWHAFRLAAEQLIPEAVFDVGREGAERLGRISDALLDLVGYVERHDADSPAYDDPRFAAWLAEQGVLSGELLGAAEIRALAQRVVLDAEAARLGVLTLDRMPEPHVLTGAATVSGLIDEAVARHESVLVDLDVAAGTGRELWDVECELCIPLPAELPHGRHLALKVTGESMEPLVHAGDVIVVRLGADVARDSVIVARSPDDGYVVKKVGRVSRRSIELLSLNAAYPAIHIPRVANLVLGTVVLRWQSGDEY